MSTIEEKIAEVELPRPEVGELLDYYARRVALIGAHVGIAHALTHVQPTVAYVPPPAAGPPEKDTVDMDEDSPRDGGGPLDGPVTDGPRDWGGPLDGPDLVV